MAINLPGLPGLSPEGYGPYEQSYVDKFDFINELSKHDIKEEDITDVFKLGSDKLQHLLGSLIEPKAISDIDKLPKIFQDGLKSLDIISKEKLADLDVEELKMLMFLNVADFMDPEQLEKDVTSFYEKIDKIGNLADDQMI